MYTEVSEMYCWEINSSLCIANEFLVGEPTLQTVTPLASHEDISLLSEIKICLRLLASLLADIRLELLTRLLQGSHLCVNG